MSTWKNMASALAIAGLVGFGAFSVGCEDEGPGEEIGEAMDDAGDNVKDAADDAGDNIKDAAD